MQEYIRNERHATRGTNTPQHPTDKKASKAIVSADTTPQKNATARRTHLLGKHDRERLVLFEGALRAAQEPLRERHVRFGFALLGGEAVCGGQRVLQGK
jgi:hypothetical protein